MYVLIFIELLSNNWRIFIISRADTKAGGSSDAEVNVGETVEYEILEEEELSEEEPTHTAGVEEDDGEEKKTSNIKEEEKKKLYEGEEKKKPYEGEEEEEEEKKPYEGDEEEEEEKMDSTPADILDACVVKYSVKTTPFLQRWCFCVVFFYFGVCSVHSLFCYLLMVIILITILANSNINHLIMIIFIIL